MSKSRLARFATLPVLGAALTLACSESPTGAALDRPTPMQSSSSAAGRWVAQVVGGQSGFDDDGLADRDVNHLAIQAKLFADGSAKGSIEVSRLLVQPADFLGLGAVARFFRLHVAVTCLEVDLQAVDGNRAWIGGIVTKGEVDIGLAGLGPPPGTIVDVTGLPLKFWMRDNEDGTFDAQLSPLEGLADCAVLDDPPIPFFRTTAGNIQIMDRR